MAGEEETRDATTGSCVLVVEDNTVNRLTLAKGVEREGHRVLTAENGRQALDVLRAERVELVLLDLVMPEMDGYEVLAAMHRDPALRDLPVLVISAVEENEAIARAIERGAIDCLPKPFDPVLLRVRLRTALQQLRLRRLEQDFLRQELALRQHDKLVTLGKLSAGLAHELNNPAGAALRSARQLEERLARAAALIAPLAASDGGRHAVEAAGDLDALVGEPPLDANRRAAVEEELEDMVSARRVAEPWTLAAELAAAGMTPAALQRWLDGVDAAAAPDALAWLVTRLGIQRSVGQVIRSVERISEIIGALRGYSYMDRAPRQAVDVRAGLDDTLTILAHKLGDGVRVEREYAAELPPVDGTGGQLNQVWTNLIDNALDALDGSGTLTLRSYASGAEVVVEVEDDGPGIPTELQGQIFDPFVTTKEPGHGTGLGLNIAHQIVTDGHRGRLTVDSRAGRTVFTVHLPMHAVAPGATEGR